MTTEIQKTNTDIKSFFQNDKVKEKFAEIIGSKTKSNAFITSVLQLTASNDLLKNADPSSVYHAAITAATLELPINNQLGLAYIVPFKNKKGVQQAQFMLGYKGLIQLALRSNQFKTISATPIYEGQLVEENPLTGFVFDFNNKPNKEAKPIGYAAYFKLLSGFEKTVYSSMEEIERHAKKYSQTYKKGFGVWKDDFEGMAQKTVLKLLLSKYAPVSVENIQKAVVVDQAIIKDEHANEVEYPDNEVTIITQEEKEQDRLIQLIQSARTVEELEKYKSECTTQELEDIYAKKGNELIDNI